jgi:hypothetical protein
VNRHFITVDGMSLCRAKAEDLVDGDRVYYRSGNMIDDGWGIVSISASDCYPQLISFTYERTLPGHRLFTSDVLACLLWRVVS